MIIDTVKGDIVQLFSDKTFSRIAHGCNCFHTMGSGVAGQLARKYPEVPRVDRDYTTYGDPSKLGGYTVAEIVGDDVSGDTSSFVYNLYTQFDFGTDSRKVEYAAIKYAFKALNFHYLRLKTVTDIKPPVLAIPQIGAGLAGGDWELISSLIDLVTPNLDIVVVEYSPST